MKIALIAAARPNFMKIAPILHAMKDYPELKPYLVHTGQHYDRAMSEVFFKELGIPIADKSILRAAFITNKKQVIQDMEEAVKQQQESQQAEMQQQEKKDQADIMAKYAKSRSDLAREKELMASAQEKIANIGQIQAKAEHESMEADLNLVKMMVELEDMQFGQFKTSWEMAQAIKMANKPEQQLTQQSA